MALQPICSFSVISLSGKSSRLEKSMVSVIFFCLLLIPLLGTTNPVKADHVLVGPGRGLFNVQIESGLTTPTASTSVRVDPAQSFGFDIRRGIFAVTGLVVVTPVLDYQQTTRTIGKDDARRLLEFGPWSRIRPTPPEILRIAPPAPPPAPPPPPTPVPTPDPRRLADPDMPPLERINRQLDIFVDEQTALVARLRAQGISEEQMRRANQALLEDQISMILRFYPQDDLLTSAALGALRDLRRSFDDQTRDRPEPQN